jgi:hypothetical protein
MSEVDFLGFLRDIVRRTTANAALIDCLRYVLDQGIVANGHNPETAPPVQGTGNRKWQMARPGSRMALPFLAISRSAPPANHAASSSFSLGPCFWCSLPARACRLGLHTSLLDIGLPEARKSNFHEASYVWSGCWIDAVDWMAGYHRVRTVVSNIHFNTEAVSALAYAALLGLYFCNRRKKSKAAS